MPAASADDIVCLFCNPSTQRIFYFLPLAPEPVQDSAISQREYARNKPYLGFRNRTASIFPLVFLRVVSALLQ